jgi:putative FmdB family regulatory protein
MPVYDYDCSACGRRFETIYGVHDDPPTVCPLCGSGPVRKAFAAPAVHFKGSGWAKKERRAKPASAGAAASEGGDDSSDTSTADTTDARTEATDAKKEKKPSTPTTPTPPPSSTANAD